MSDCLSAHNSETGMVTVSKSSRLLNGTEQMVLGTKSWGSWVGGMYGDETLKSETKTKTFTSRDRDVGLTNRDETETF